MLNKQGNNIQFCSTLLLILNHSVLLLLLFFLTALCSFINHSSTVASVKLEHNWDLKDNIYSTSNNLKEATTSSFHRHAFMESIQY